MLTGYPTEEDKHRFLKLRETAQKFYKMQLVDEERRIYDLYKTASPIQEYLDQQPEGYLKTLGISEEDYRPFIYDDIHQLGHLMKKHTGNKFLKYLMDSLNELSKKFEAKDDITLYRATFLDDIIEDVSEDVITLPYVISCSYDLWSLRPKFTHPTSIYPILFIIQCKSGSKMCPMEGNPFVTAEESEMLLGASVNLVRIGVEGTSISEMKLIMGNFPPNWNTLIKYHLKLN